MKDQGRSKLNVSGFLALREVRRLGLSHVVTDAGHLIVRLDNCTALVAPLDERRFKILRGTDFVRIGCLQELRDACHNRGIPYPPPPAKER